MSDGTGISWTDATWNPVTGCTKVSGGTGYVEDSDGNRLAFGKAGKPLLGARCTRCSGAGSVGVGDTTGVRMHEDRLDVPLRWRKPRKVFVCSMADLFHDSVSSSFIASVFAVMALSPQHTFQVLTKRPARMRALLSGWGIRDLVMDRFGNDDDLLARRALSSGGGQAWPLPNVWLGVSVEDQRAADLRIPVLLDTPAAVRWLSCEPLLGRVELRMESGCPDAGRCHHACTGGHCWRVATCEPLTGYRAGEPYAGLWDEEDRRRATGIDWVVVGGESGPNARPMHPDWARSLRDQCASAGVPFHFKQWGESAGRLLDGVLHDEYPGGAA